MLSSDIVILGGGVIGCSVAYFTAKKGYSVIIVEKEDIASGTSGACDRAIHLQAKNPGIHLKLALESAKMFPDLQNTFDTNIHYRETGVMIIIQSQAHLEVMKNFVKRQQDSGLNVDILDEKETLRRQPALNTNIVGSTYSTFDGEIDPQKLCLGYFREAKKLGAKALLGTKATMINTKNGRVESVETTAGSINCKFVVNACGSYAPFIGQMVNIEIPIIPRQGQLIVSEPIPQLIHGTINCSRYIITKFKPELLEKGEKSKIGLGLSLGQTLRGNLLIGGTRAFKGYDKKTTHKETKIILQHAINAVPALKDIHMIRTFAGLRPYTPDGLPILGKVPQLEGFIMAAGHEGDGLCLSPITGKIISEIIAEEKSSIDIDINKLSLSRFKKS